MKILFFSDIHGVPSTLAKVLEHADALEVDRLVILGDLLYHGPRNGVPDFYDPKLVAEMLNARKNKILTVRGNCDCEVDQMMLEFPVLSNYAELSADGRRFFLTHGHVYNAANLPPVPDNTVIVHGHTHVPEITGLADGIVIFNPGSISLPKNDHPRTFGLSIDGELSVRLLEDGSIYMQ
ncbi:MAG: phosphodiesterase [Lentisphaeria bacterium]|nr:phosphodiesterase [Lentisphaeria bacterium]MBQ7395022.1 phosphodiesterase [Lentisphaeria bacterium]